MRKKCPGSKIKSKGLGRGLGTGKGKGAIGIPYYAKKRHEIGMIEAERKSPFGFDKLI